MSAAFPSRRLDEIAQSIDYGLTASATNENTGNKFLRITDIQDGTVNWSAVPFCDAASGKLRSAALGDGDIVFARTGATTGKSVLIKSPPEKAVFASYLIRVRPSKSVDPGFLAHFFQSTGYWGQIRLKTQGAAQGGVNATSLGGLEIPLPPLDEQRRIAAILDKADALRRKRKRALELLDGLTQSIFLEMFGDPFTNPRKLKLGRVGDLLEGTQYGTSDRAGSSGQFPILRMGNLTINGKIVVEDLKYIDLSPADIGKYTVKRGDILFNRTNSADLVGKTAVFQMEQPYAYAGYLVRARVRRGVVPEYLSGYLNSSHGKATLRGMAKSIVGMANINAREMQSIPILIPSEQDQSSYQRRLRAVAERATLCSSLVQSAEELFASLQHRAFSGQL